MPLKNCDYWIFDMDGTLTLPIHDFEDIRKQLGISDGALILETIENMPKEKAERAAKLLHDIEMDLAHKAQPQPMVESILEALINKEKRLGVLTRNGEEIAKTTLEAAGLSQFFEKETIVGRESCAPKPKPDGVHYLLKLWNAPKTATVIIGDYLYDIQAGFEAGINTVHFDSFERFLWPEFAHHKISRLEQLKFMM